MDEVDSLANLWPAPNRHAPIEGGYQTTSQPNTRLYGGDLGRRKTAGPEDLNLAAGAPHYLDMDDWAINGPGDAPLTPVGEAIAAFRNGPGDGGAKALFAAQVAEMVNSPGHYTAAAVECIDAIRQALGAEGFVAFCHGNALKYLWRANYKENREQDLKKATWYLRMATGDDPRKEHA